MNAHIITNRTVSAGTLTRTAALGLALTNQLLSAAGKSVLPIDNARLEQMICTQPVLRLGCFASFGYRPMPPRPGSKVSA